MDFANVVFVAKKKGENLTRKLHHVNFVAEIKTILATQKWQCIRGQIFGIDGQYEMKIKCQKQRSDPSLLQICYEYHIKIRCLKGWDSRYQ